MTKDEFEKIIIETLDELPQEIKDKLDNVEIIIKKRPTIQDFKNFGIRFDTNLLGVYRGVPLPLRDSHYTFVSPDIIYIYQEPIEKMCKTNQEIVTQIRKTVLHEIGHFFGLDEEKLKKIK